ncbi:uncharacterized protein DUF433 [Nitrospirillum amazonense]|uniref:Uncharacterized protein DUF433 n=1 Tax=Nitrospirillum amazonense TaxID=28077 RepID=A0A560FP99_9PROT|nr:DUF433 domain-containing protein [Nitrospirillum amazonense]TWB23447.1 uncharacterized protein DUF433 [Nitrospirillum amazonense]
MPNMLEFTAAEAAFVLREPIKAVRKAMDEGPVQARLVTKAGGPVRAIAWRDLVYLHAVRTLREELTPKGRTEFYLALKRSPAEGTREVRFGRLSVTMDAFEAEVEARAQELSALADKVEFRADGEPLLKGTAIEVHRIAALLAGGLSAEEIRDDYPSVTPAMVDTAKAYADVHPKPGRPYPRTTVKRALRGAGLEALDEVLDGPASEP